MARTERASSNIIDGVIWKGLLSFFFPILLGTFFQQLYNTVDAWVVGNFVNETALAAVGGSAAQILGLIVNFFVGLSSGATVIVSQFFGAEDDEGVSKAVHTAMALAIVGGAIMTVIGLVCAPALLRLMNTPEDTMEQSTLYLRILFAMMIPSMIYNVGSGIQRAIGDSKRPLYFLIVCCLINIVLDLLFVLQFNLGVAGVAIATGIAQIVSAVLVCVYLCRAKGSYRLELRKIRADMALLKRTLRIGLPAGMQSVLYALSNMTITATINSFGTLTVAAWVAMGKVDAMFWMVNGAFGVSITTFVGQNYGARRYDRVEKGMKVCTALAMAASVLFGVVFMVFGRHIFRIFTGNAEVLEIAALMLSYMAPCFWLYVPIEMLSGSLRGMGDTLVPTLITAVGICVLRVVWLFTVVPVWTEILAITISYPISWILTGAAFILYYAHVRKTLLPVKAR